MDMRCWESGDFIKFLTLIEPHMRLTLTKVRFGSIWEAKGQMMWVGLVLGAGEEFSFCSAGSQVNVSFAICLLEGA